MLQIFEGESGGYIIAPIDPSVPAVSGYAQFLGRQQVQYRIDGFLASGSLYISKSGIGQFQPGEYLMLAQVVDANNLIYFLDPVDIEVVAIPDFVESTYFLSGDTFIASFIAHIQNYNNPHQTTAQQVGAEPNLGNPLVSGYVLSSDVSGHRLWVAQTGGSGGSDAYFHFSQASPSATWLITHNLGKKPSVDVIDTAGDNVRGFVTYIDDNTLRIDFSAIFSGDAFLN